MPRDDCSRAEACPPCVNDLDEDGWNARKEAELLGLTDMEAGLLEIARLACEQLNKSLELARRPHRWNVLGDSDPRRRRK